ncbi:DivIVA domain-containing protein [Nonomuraea sp. NPDC059007]|uniref:DivIVA domain-containing protein n=1 Tax=Nonomuraea sp. NPDC059007 TaxID=3346692 RepID=UPI003693579B
MPHLIAMYTFDVVLRGYKASTVNDLFTRINKTLDGTASDAERVTPDEIRATELRIALRGYHRRQVDEALRDVLTRLS